MPINIPRGFAISAPGAGRLRRAIGSIQADRVPLLDVAKGLGQLGPTLTGIGVQGMEQERKDAERAAVVELEEEHLLAEEELEAESEGRERTEEDLARYRDRMAARVASVYVDDATREDMRQSLGKLDAQMASRAGDYNRTFIKTKRNQDAQRVLTGLMDRGNYQQATEVLELSKNFLTPTQERAWHNRIVVGTETQRFREVLAEGGLVAGAEYIDTLMKRENLSDEVKEALQASFTADLGRIRATQNREREQEALNTMETQQRLITDITLAQDEGKFSAEQLLALRERRDSSGNPTLTEKQFRDLYERGKRVDKDRREVMSRAETFGTHMMTGNPVDPSDKDMQKAATEFADRALPAFETYSQWSPQDKGTLMNVARLNGKPDQLEGVLMAGLAADSPEVTESAADLAQDLQRLSPMFWGGYSERLRGFYNTINLHRDYGTPISRAVNEFTRVTAAERDIAKVLYKREDVDIDDNSEDFMDRVFDDDTLDPAWVGPEVAGRLGVQYDAFVRDAYNITHNLDSARQTAWERMRRVIGPSRVNGEQTVMAYPPEYIGGRVEPIDSTWIREDFTRDMSSIGLDAAGHQIVSDPLTPSDQTYGVLDENNNIVYDDENVPLRWRPDVERWTSESNAKSAIDAEATQAIFEEQRQIAEEMRTELDAVEGWAQRDLRINIRQHAERRSKAAEERELKVAARRKGRVSATRKKGVSWKDL